MQLPFLPHPQRPDVTFREGVNLLTPFCNTSLVLLHQPAAHPVSTHTTVHSPLADAHVARVVWAVLNLAAFLRHQGADQERHQQRAHSPHPDCGKTRTQEQADGSRKQRQWGDCTQEMSANSETAEKRGKIRLHLTQGTGFNRAARIRPVPVPLGLT